MHNSSLKQAPSMQPYGELVDVHAVQDHLRREMDDLVLIECDREVAAQLAPFLAIIIFVGEEMGVDEELQPRLCISRVKEQGWIENKRNEYQEPVTTKESLMPRLCIQRIMRPMQEV